jgi:hypothetical protein
MRFSGTSAGRNLRHRITSATKSPPAAPQSFQGKHRPFHQTMTPQRLRGIHRARWLEPARWLEFRRNVIVPVITAARQLGTENVHHSLVMIPLPRNGLARRLASQVSHAGHRKRSDLRGNPKQEIGKGMMGKGIKKCASRIIPLATIPLPKIPLPDYSNADFT